MGFVLEIVAATHTVLSYLIPFIFVLSVVVFFHELGHFAVARIFGTKVDVFSIGFGREIFGWYDRFGTRWRVSWLPLGGYVKFFGDDSAASTPDRGALEEQARNLSPRERAACFHFKPLPQRAAIVAAGPIANFVLAIVIFAVIFATFGEVILSPRIDAIRPGSAAEEAGLRPGDLIVAVDGNQIQAFKDLQGIVSLSADTPLQLRILRDDRFLDVTAVPRRGEVEDQFGNVHRIGLLGIERINAVRVDGIEPGSGAERAGLQEGDLISTVDGQPVVTVEELQAAVADAAGRPLMLDVNRGTEVLKLEAVPTAAVVTDDTGRSQTVGVLGVRSNPGGESMKVIKYNPAAATWRGVRETGFVIERTFRYLGRLVSGREEANQLGGPLSIARMSGQMATLGIIPLINLTAFLSVSIGLINLFPIPMLDGGHLLYYGYEAAAGRPLTEQAQEYGFRIGLALVLCLMVFATWNDLVRLPFVNGLLGLL